MSGGPSPRPKFVLAVVLSAATLLVSVRNAEAGPTKYDPKTKSFRITYTYAALPSLGMPPDQIALLGSQQTATTEQDTNVRAYYKQVSLILDDVTDHRASISSFDYVDSVKKADLIISLTGLFDRAGWAVPGAIDGQAGQIGLYYQYLASRTPQEIANTAAHELCHYLFSLPDEYSNVPGVIAECPLQNPQSPGCLMDNYYVRHGYRKLCVDSDHNADGPRSNPGTIVTGHRAEQSCQFWIDEFFKVHPPDPDASDASSAPDSAAKAIAALNSVSNKASSGANPPFTGSLQRLQDSAAMKVRSDALAMIQGFKDKKRPVKELTASTLRKSATDFLKAQIQELAGDPEFSEPTAQQLRQSADKVVQDVLAGLHVGIPSRFNKDTVAKLAAKATELVKTLPQSKTSLLQQLIGNQLGQPSANTDQLVSTVLRELVRFAASAGLKAMIGFAPPTSQQKAEEDLFLKQLAQQAVLGGSGSQDHQTFYDAANIHIQLTYDASRTINAIASELDIPGSELRKVNFRELEAQYEALRLPGHVYNAFQSKRTYIVAPMPLNPELDVVTLDAGDNLDYGKIRELAVDQIRRLILRERVEVPVSTVADYPSDPPGIRQARRFSAQVDLIKQIEQEVRRDRVANLIFFAPPGGLGVNLDDALEDLRRLILKDSDIRVDVILFTQGTIPLRLRDLVARTGGSVQLALDLDELGAVAQRIESEVATGSWVIQPQTGYLDLTLKKPEDLETNTQTRDPVVALSNPDLKKKYIADVPVPIWKDPSEPLPLLSLSIQDFKDFNKRIEIFSTTFLRDRNLSPNYVGFTSTVSGLFQTQVDLTKMKQDLDKILELPVNPKTHDAIKTLIANVYHAKQNLRGIFGLKGSVKSPLLNTDDHTDWMLRKLLVDEAGRLNDNYLKKYGTLSPTHRHKLLFDTVNLWQRASVQSQKIADLGRMYFLASQGTQEGQSNLSERLQVSATMDNIEVKIEEALRTESRIAPGASSLIMDAAELLLERVEGLQAEFHATIDAAKTQFEQVPPDRSFNVGIGGMFPEIGRMFPEIGRMFPESNLPWQSEKVTTAFDLHKVNIDPKDPLKPKVNIYPKDLLKPTDEEMKTIYNARTQYLVGLWEAAENGRPKDDLWPPRDEIVEQRYANHQSNYRAYQVYYLNQAAQLLQRASALPNDFGQFNKLVVKLNTLLSKLDNIPATSRWRDPYNNEIFIKARLPVLDTLVKLLNQRKESLLAVNVARMPNNSMPLKSNLELDDDVPNRENGLTPWLEALKLDDELRDDALFTIIRPLNDDDLKTKEGFKNYRDQMKKRLDELNFDVYATVDDVNARFEEITYAEFPLLILNTLGRLREFENDLKVYQKSLLNKTDLQPAFDRLSRPPTRPRIAYDLAKDGQLTEIAFHPFQVEERAEFEIIIGLSRPLRLFAKMRDNPPQIRLYKDEKDLVDQPYLRFDEELSTENMLVFRVPRPKLRVGYLSTGTYTPSLVIDRQHMPILSRDNTVNYTFSIATPRPNVQLIAGLLQPQPTPDDRNKETDKDREFAYRNTIASNFSEVVVQVEVLAGAPVTHSNVRGNYQMIVADNAPISFPSIRFSDDGLPPDNLKDDGVYTARITLKPSSQRVSTEYRLFIQANWTDKDEYISLAETMPNIEKPDPAVPKGGDPPAVPTYERSTSINFHVEAEN